MIVVRGIDFPVSPTLQLRLLRLAHDEIQWPCQTELNVVSTLPCHAYTLLALQVHIL